MREYTKIRKDFWEAKRLDAERVQRLERWEQIFTVKLFREKLLDS